MTEDVEQPAAEGQGDETVATSEEGSKVATSRGRAKSAAERGGVDFIARVEDPAPEPEASAEEPAAPLAREVRAGFARIRYEGTADRIEAGPDGQIVFRPGQAAQDVPTEVAEELLTHPTERFTQEEPADELAPEGEADGVVKQE